MTIYLTPPEVFLINEQVLARDGQQSLLRDEGALESALMRPQTASHYEQANLVRQAALLVAGIALAHAFLDGNKRTALLAGTVFLDLNGGFLETEPLEFARQIEALVNHTEPLEAATEHLVVWMNTRFHKHTISE
jgi:death-on-curing protein